MHVIIFHVLAPPATPRAGQLMPLKWCPTEFEPKLLGGFLISSKSIQTEMRCPYEKPKSRFSKCYKLGTKVATCKIITSKFQTDRIMFKIRYDDFTGGHFRSQFVTF